MRKSVRMGKSLNREHCHEIVSVCYQMNNRQWRENLIEKQRVVVRSRAWNLAEKEMKKAERQGGAQRDEMTYFRRKATTLSPCVVPSEPWPPAAITTYCLPSLPIKVDGVACAPALSSVCHSSSPVVLS